MLAGRTSVLDNDKETRLTLSREDLYELAWSKPISELAKDFGISDVGLAKRCRRLPIKGSARSMIIIVVPPLAKLVVEQVGIVGNAVFVQELIKLLLIDTV